MKIFNKNKPEEKVVSEPLSETVTSKQEQVPLAPERLQETEEAKTPDANHEQIRAQIENMDLDDTLKAQVPSHVNDVQSLNVAQMIKSLLVLAKTKGVIFAVHVAKKIDDPYVLDMFHDALVTEGYYKEFIK